MDKSKQSALVSSTDFKAYLKEAKTWDADRVEQSNKSRKTAWVVAAIAIAIGVGGFVSAFIKAMEPAPPPVVLRVDNSTGIVDDVSRLEGGQENYQEAVNKHFAQAYIKYREGFSLQLAEEYYYYVGIMSAPIVQQQYFSFFTPKNPNSPLNVYGQYARVTIQVKSTSFINPKVALVRYIKRVERGADLPEITHWAATIAFKYSGAEMKHSDRTINPLGFQVTEYRNDPESVVGDVKAAPGATPQFVPGLPNAPTAAGAAMPAQATVQVPAIR